MDEFEAQARLLWRSVMGPPAPSEQSLSAFTSRILGTLTPRQEKVLRLRFGLDDGYRRTLEEVGQDFALTRERIRQIQAKALRKLRHPSRQKKIERFALARLVGAD